MSKENLSTEVKKEINNNLNNPTMETKETKKEIINLTKTMSKNKVKNDAKKENLKKKIEISKGKQISDLDLLKIDLDALNLDKVRELIITNKKVKNVIKTSKNVSMYRNKQNQKSRTKIRKQRNRYIDNILFYFESKNVSEMKKEIISFNKFYKEIYSLNDYTLNSIADNNSDADTKVKINLCFAIIKKQK